MSFECLDYKKMESGALQGFANFKLAKMGVELFGCGVFMKNGKRWVSMPSREYVDKESGDKKYIAIMRFINKDHAEAFSRSALQALDKWCDENAKSLPPADVEQEGVPF